MKMRWLMAERVFIPWPRRLYALSVRVMMFLMPIGAAPLPCPRLINLSSSEPPNEGVSAMPKPVLTKYSISCIVFNISVVDFSETP